MESQVLGFLQLLQLQAVQQNMCAPNVVKFSAATIRLHITRASIRGKRDAPFVRSCSLGNTLWCLIFPLSMALNISPDNSNSTVYQLWEWTFYVPVGGRSVCNCVTYMCFAYAVQLNVTIWWYTEWMKTNYVLQWLCE